MDADGFDYAIAALASLRKEGVAAEIYPEPAKLKKQLSYADKMGIPYAIVIGADERASQTFTVRNLATGVQTTETLSTLMDSVRTAF
jgi:histidyl-tRNA synthetase